MSSDLKEAFLKMHLVKIFGGCRIKHNMHYNWQYHLKSQQKNTLKVLWQFVEERLVNH